ncbi:MAG: hypothetical protein ABFD54_17245 [Armatimonadota bacterium]
MSLLASVGNEYMQVLSVSQSELVKEFKLDKGKKRLKPIEERKWD